MLQHSEAEKSVKSISLHALVILKEQTKIHQHAQQNKVNM